jgi:transposase
MSFLRHGEIYPPMRARPRTTAPPTHRLDEFPAGYSLAGWSPPEPASASPADAHFEVQSYRRSSVFHRTANSVLTGCLTPGGRRRRRTWAAWLYDLLKPHVTKVTVCNPRKNALLKSGNKSDRIDARKLAELLRNGSLSAVYHGEKGIRTLKELSRSYPTVSRDLTRVMSRLKALYQSWGIACAGTQVYAPRHRSEWLSKITVAGVRCRAEFIYQQLDCLQALRQGVRHDLLAESRKHAATTLLRQIPGIGPIRVALLIALMQTPDRFRTKRQLWAYSGLAIETRSSAEYRYVEGELRRSQKPVTLRGLNKNHNHDLKWIFKSAAIRASASAGPLHEFYEALLAKGMKPSMARLNLARKIAAITLTIWKKGADFDVEHLKQQAA